MSPLKAKAVVIHIKGDYQVIRVSSVNSCWTCAIHPSSANDPACKNFSQKFSISKLQHPTLACQNIGQDSGIKNCACINSFSIANLIKEVELNFHWHPANPHFCYQILDYSFTIVLIMDLVAVHPLSHSDGEHTHCHLTFATLFPQNPLENLWIRRVSIQLPKTKISE